MPESVTSYHARRAAAERALAASAGDAFIARVHYELAALHEQKAGDLGGDGVVSKPRLSLVSDTA